MIHAALTVHSIVIYFCRAIALLHVSLPADSTLTSTHTLAWDPPLPCPEAGAEFTRMSASAPAS